MMKTTKEERVDFRQSIDYAKDVHGTYYETPIENDLLERLLDDVDELARLREGLWDEASEWRKAGAHFSGDPLGDAAHRIANRLETLLNNGDEEES